MSIELFSKHSQVLDPNGDYVKDLGKKYRYLCNFGSSEFPRRSPMTQKAVMIQEDLWLPLSQVRLMAVHKCNNYAYRLYIAEWLYKETKKKLVLFEAKKYLKEIEKRRPILFDIEAYAQKNHKHIITNNIEDFRLEVSCYLETIHELTSLS